MFNRIMKRLTSYSMKYMVAKPGAMTFICSKSKSPSIIRISDSIDSWRLQKSIMRGPNVQYPQKPNPTIRIPLATKKTTRSFYSIRGEGRREKEERKMVNDEDKGGRMWKNRQKLLGYNRFLPTLLLHLLHHSSCYTHTHTPPVTFTTGWIHSLSPSFCLSLLVPPCPSFFPSAVRWDVIGTHSMPTIMSLVGTVVIYQLIVVQSLGTVLNMDISRTWGGILY